MIWRPIPFGSAQSKAISVMVKPLQASSLYSRWVGPFVSMAPPFCLEFNIMIIDRGVRSCNLLQESFPSLMIR